MSLTSWGPLIALFAASFVIVLAARQMGEIFARIKLPLISGFLFIGIIAGPFVLDFVHAENIPRFLLMDELALAFIDFLQVPKNAARTSEYLYYPSPNEAATKLLPEELLTDENVYPSSDALAHAFRYEAMAPRTIRKRSSIYQNVVGNIAAQ